MKIKTVIIAVLMLVFSMSAVAEKKKTAQRGMLESMQSVPCGSKERGLTGLGSMVGSVGVTHVNSQEKLCLTCFCTDDMDYHIRPDTKHAAVLPVGKEAEFKVKKDRMFLRMVDDKKAEQYQVVVMQPANADSKGENASYHPADKPRDDSPRDDKSSNDKSTNDRPANDKPADPRPPANSGANPPNSNPPNGSNSDKSDDNPHL